MELQVKYVDYIDFVYGEGDRYFVNAFDIAISTVSRV